MAPLEAIGNVGREMAPTLSATKEREECLEQPEAANKDLGMTDLDQLLKSERKREKEEMEIAPVVRDPNVRGDLFGPVAGSELEQQCCSDEQWNLSPYVTIVYI